MAAHPLETRANLLLHSCPTPFPSPTAQTQSSPSLMPPTISPLPKEKPEQPLRSPKPQIFTASPSPFCSPAETKKSQPTKKAAVPISLSPSDRPPLFPISLCPQHQCLLSPPNTTTLPPSHSRQPHLKPLPQHFPFSPCSLGQPPSSPLSADPASIVPTNQPQQRRPQIHRPLTAADRKKPKGQQPYGHTAGRLKQRTKGNEKKSSCEERSRSAKEKN
jgi:hypothetical protein